MFFFTSRRLLTAVDYTVTIEGADPNPLFIATPDENELARSLSPQAELCVAACNPSLCQSFMLMGGILSEDVDDIRSALIEAYVVANPGSDSEDYEVVFTHINDELVDHEE